MNLISTLLVLSKKQKEVLTVWSNSSLEIKEQLQEILSDESNRLRQAYCLLETIIEIESRSRGPRNFRKLLDQIFDFMKAYSYDRIQAYEQQIVILNLTYYQKIFKLSLTPIQKVETLVIFATANIHAFLRNSDKKRLNSVQDKLNQANEVKIQDVYLINVLLLLNAIVMHLRSEHKKAKTMLANLLTKVINEKELLKCHRNLQIMAICSYYSYLNLQGVGQRELSWYYLTKASQFGKRLQGAGRFLEKIKQIGEHKTYCVVKLTRIQNKLEVLKRTKSSWHSKTMKCKIYSSKNNHDENQIHEELKNIFTIKDTKVTMYKLRKDNLRYLNGEENKLLLNIKRKQDELIQIQNFRNNLGAGEQISNIEKQIKGLKEDRGEMRKEYDVLKIKYLRELKQVKVINKYFKTLIILPQFKKSVYIYNFLYGKMFSRAKIFILSLFLKRRIRKIKKVAKTIKLSLNGLLHFVEIFEIIGKNTEFFLYRKKEVGFYLRIYPIEKKDDAQGIEDERKLEPHIFERLLTTPLSYEFEVSEGRLLSWSEYLCRKSFMTIHYVKKFIHRLSKKYKNKENPEIYRIINVYLLFNGYASIYTQLFACFSQVQEHNLYPPNEIKSCRYKGTIYTIGGPKYKNSLYNVTINQCTIFDSSTTIEQIGQLLVTEEFMKNCNTKLEAVKMIQKFIKLSYCKKKLKALKSKAKIAVFVQGGDVITYCKYLMGKSYLVVQNIFTKDRESMETIMDFNSFQQIVLIRDKLSREKTCKDKLKLTCKYIWTRFFISKLKDHIKSAAILTDFQVSFRNRVIFSKLFSSFIYKRKPVIEKIVFTLSVESLLQFPRPYILRIFTVDQGIFIADITVKIYNRDKLFYEKNLQNLNKIVNILSRTQIELINQGDQLEMPGSRRRSSRISQTSRASRVKVIHSITNMSSDDEIKTSSVEAEIIPKVMCKKTSMLARFRNRRSNMLGRDDNLDSDLSENGSQS